MITAETVQKSFITQHKPAPVCGNCKEYDRGLCKLRARADWEDDAYVTPTKKACSLASLYPF